MQETIWLGNLVRVGSKTPRYLYNETPYSIEFRTIKDKNELGWLDKKSNTMYFNDDYKAQFIQVKKQIIKDYHPGKTEQYLNVIF
jgi:hypothetical protein